MESLRELEAALSRALAGGGGPSQEQAGALLRLLRRHRASLLNVLVFAVRHVEPSRWLPLPLWHLMRRLRGGGKKGGAPRRRRRRHRGLEKLSARPSPAGRGAAARW